MRPLRSRFGCLIALAVAVSTTINPVIADAQVVEQTGSAEVRVALGMDEPRAVVHIEENDRVVVVGDDEALIISVTGEILFRIEGLSGANAIEADGVTAVVAAPGTGELVLIDTDTGAVTTRILTGAQSISSIALSGDDIWFAHGPVETYAGVGRASISQGTATASVASRHYPFRTGMRIDVSPERPDQIFLVPRGVSPANIFRVDLLADGTHTSLRNPYHASFFPFVVAEDGSRVWTFNNGNVLELNPDDLTRTGMFYELFDAERYTDTVLSLANHDDELLAFANRGFVTTYRVGEPAIAATADFNEAILGVDLDETRLFTLTGSMPYRNDDLPSTLTISDHDRTRPDRLVVLNMFAFGDAPSDRPTFTFSCNAEPDVNITARYGWAYQILVSPDTTNCSIRRSTEPQALNSSHTFGDDETWATGFIRVPITSETSLQDPVVVHVVDTYDSPLTDPRRFVELQYRDILNRNPDRAGVDFWTDRILRGQITPAGYVESLVDSPEYLGSIAPVTRLYYAYFNRVPDDSGLAYWLSRYGQTSDLDGISSAFAQSDEFQDTYGSLTDRDFLSLVYQNVLGRLPDEDGYRFWLDRMDDGLTRGALMTAFSESPEYVEQTNAGIVVRTIYRGLLRREPDATGRAFWVEEYRQGQSLERMIHGFLTSEEYTNRFWVEDRAPAARGVEVAEFTPGFAAPMAPPIGFDTPAS